MAFDLSGEQSQVTYGPVPSGSEVMLELELLEPSQPINEHRFVRAAQSGLLQIYCKFTVAHGTYAGVSFRQNISLPAHTQKIQLTQGQTKACNIGGAQLKAMCEAARKPTKMRDIMELNGLRFPASVRINPNPTEKDGRTYWNNELGIVITPDKPHYDEIVRGGEFITDGPTTGKAKASGGFGGSNGGGYDYGASNTPDYFGDDSGYPVQQNTDQVPF